MCETGYQRFVYRGSVEPPPHEDTVLTTMWISIMCAHSSADFLMFSHTRFLVNSQLWERHDQSVFLACDVFKEGEVEGWWESVEWVKKFVSLVLNKISDPPPTRNRNGTTPPSPDMESHRSLLWKLKTSLSSFPII